MNQSQERLDYSKVYYKCRNCGMLISHKGLKKIISKYLEKEYGMNITLFETGALKSKPEKYILKDSELYYSTCPTCKDGSGFEQLYSTGEGLLETLEKRMEEDAMKFEKPEKQVFEKPLIKTGVYTAKLIKDVDDAGEDKFGNPQILWKFAILDDKGNPIKTESGNEVVLPVWSKCKFGEKSKETKIYKALGGNYDDEEELDTASLVGQTCQVVVKTVKSKEGEDMSVIGDFLE